MEKILGIGNALVDILISLNNEEFLNQFNLPKGSMQLVNETIITDALSKAEGLKQNLASGGSAANTINGLANLGAKTAFIGKVGSDIMGEFFEKDMATNGIETMLLKGKGPTGTALAFITPDSERTFAVNLGAAIELTPSDISKKLFEGYNYLHVEGYLVQNHDLIEKILKTASENAVKISLDLASYNVVEANSTFLNHLVKNYVDIVFANEDEATAFTGKSPEESVIELSKLTEIAIVKLGAKGSLIKFNDFEHHAGIIKVNPIDTTGAGDMYASGFIFGLSKNLSLEQCAEIGAILSGKVIERIGPKMDATTWKEIHGMVNNIINSNKKYTTL